MVDLAGKTEAGRQKPEAGGRKPEDWSWKPEAGRWELEKYIFSPSDSCHEEADD
ncbi:MAG: hypothetical protein KFF73_20265 [Cyclobacteriaceae bacterium]|nr:hypothetical protein [Cyclobacteriaceae bacterium]